MRSHGDTKQITRREVICECVKAYVRNNFDEFEAFKKGMQDRRARLGDRKFGRNMENGKADNDMRTTFVLPSKLRNALQTILDGHQEPEFLYNDHESVWFAKKFPIFLLGEKY